MYELINRFNATQKGALAQGIFHRLVAEYLDCVYRFLDPEEASTKMHALLETYVPCPISLSTC
jgi:pumilio family protein 6